MTEEKLEERVKRRDRIRIVIVAFASIIITALLTYIVTEAIDRGQAVVTQTEQKEVAQGDAATNADAADRLCDQVKKLGRQCVVNPANLAPVQGERGMAGPPPTDADVLRAVQQYFAINPVRNGRPPSPAEIATAVINYLRENPPPAGPPGSPPSPDQVSSAVQAYLIEHPPPEGPQGDQGPPGEPGRPPTADEIAAAVSAYMETHPLPMCPDGSAAGTVTVVNVDNGEPTKIITCVSGREQGP